MKQNNHTSVPAFSESVEIINSENTPILLKNWVAHIPLYRYAQTMATHAADPREQNPDSDTATLERKRPHDVISYHNASNLGSAHSTPRKRARKAGKLGHQDVRDFVPVGASFSTSVVPIDEIRESGDDGSQEELDLNTETLSDNEPFEVSESNSTEAQQKALVEGRRLFISDLPVDITEEQLRQFFKGYSV